MKSEQIVGLVAPEPGGDGQAVLALRVLPENLIGAVIVGRAIALRRLASAATALSTSSLP